MPGRNDVKTADDIERVRIYHYKIKNSNSVEMKTDDFNDSSLDLIWVCQLKFLTYNLKNKELSLEHFSNNLKSMIKRSLKIFLKCTSSSFVPDTLQVDCIILVSLRHAI